MLQQTRETQILDAAEALFLQSGLKRITMDDIAELVGVSRPAIYQYFSSKSDIASMALKRMHQRSLDSVWAAIRQARGLKSQLQAAIEARDGVFLDQRLSAPVPLWYLDMQNSWAATEFEKSQAGYQNILRLQLIRSRVHGDEAAIIARLLVMSAMSLRDIATDPEEFSSELGSFLSIILEKHLPAGSQTDSDGGGAAGFGDAASRIVM